MSEENLPLWKLAAKDNQHPLHQATWLLFADKFNPKFADKQLADKKEEIIEYLYLILDTDDLYYEAAFGSGFAPIHACELLGHWQITEAIPHLLRIIIEYDFDDAELAWDRAISALEKMGDAVIEPFFAAVENNEDIDLISVASVFAQVGKDNPRCFEFIKDTFEKQTDEWDIMALAEYLLMCNQEAAIPYLESRLQHFKYPKGVRVSLLDYIQDAKKGNFL